MSGGRVAGGGGAGSGDVGGPASSVDGEVALFSGTGGKTLKRAVSSGIAKLVSGVLSLIALPADATKFLDGTGAFSTPAGGVGGSTGATDNMLLRADGTGGATLQNTGIVVNDSNQMQGQLGFPRATIGATLTVAQSGQTVRISNGNAGEVVLPTTPTLGTFFFFICVADADSIAVQCDTVTHVIYIGASASSAGGSASSSTKGSMLRLEYVATDLWFGIASGAWALA